MDMRNDVLGESSFGKAALAKLGQVGENFRIFRAGWVGKDLKTAEVMEVEGAEFRVAERGRYAGQMAIRVPGSTRTVRVTREEISAAERMG